MTTRGLIVTMEAQAGKEQEVERFLTGAQALVEEEPGTVAWFAVRLGPTTFGIFDVFDDDSGREAHLNGRVAEALFGQADSLFASAPSVQKLDVLADKLPTTHTTGETTDGGGWEASEWSGERPGGPTHHHVPGTDDSGTARTEDDNGGGWSASEWSDSDRPRE
jgi:quinol monooxygenase YgiN